MRIPRLPFHLLILLLLAIPLRAGAAEAPSDRVSETMLAAGTAWATPAIVRRSPRTGPTVFVIGGMHGSEPAGWRAARQIQHWPIMRGKLIVIPRANELGCRKGVRLVPADEDFDLNRQFPRKNRARVSGKLASSIWKLLRRYRPDWVIDLHESRDYRHKTTAEQKPLGNSLICFPGAETERVAQRMAEAVNALVSKAERRWVVIQSPIEGSLARAAGQRMGAHSIIAETCVKDYLAVRVRGHRLHVHRLLTDLDMLPDGFSPHTVFASDRESVEIRVALYNDGGTGGSAAYSLERCLRLAESVVAHRITAGAIRAGALSQYDVIAFPGGTGSGTSKALGETARENVRRFVKQGGGLLGVCAGAYLATSHYSWSLGVLDAKVLDTRHWARGRGTVRMGLTDAGKELFRDPRDTVNVRYAQGPLLAPGSKDEIPDYEPLAIFETEVAKNGAPRGVMIGTPAIVRGAFGDGRVVVSSPHPESSKELEGYILQAVLWLARAR